MNKTCNYCHKQNHFSKVCFKRKNVNTVSEDTVDESVYLLGNIDIDVTSNSNWRERVIFKDINKSLIFKLDTGAGCNVIKISDYQKLGFTNKINKTSARLANYNGSEIPVVGKVNLTCQVKDRIQNLDFYVADCSHAVLVLGLQTIEKLDLIKRVAELKCNDTEIKDLVNEYNKIFQGTGKITKIYDFKMKPDYEGKIEPCRRVPFKLQSQYKQELWNKKE